MQTFPVRTRRVRFPVLERPHPSYFLIVDGFPVLKRFCPGKDGMIRPTRYVFPLFLTENGGGILLRKRDRKAKKTSESFMQDGRKNDGESPRIEA